MRAYTAVVGARCRVLLQYRAAAMAGFATQLFWGLIRIMILGAFYHGARSLPMSLRDTVTYVWLGQAMLAMFPWNVEPDLRALVRSGAVAYELVRPLDLYGFWFSRCLAMRSAPVVLRAVPLCVLAMPFLGMALPPSWGSFWGWVLTTLGALALSAAVTALMSMSLLWTVSGEGMTRLMPALVMLLSGMVIPLPLFPAWAQSWLDLQPFRGVCDAPFRVYTGHIPASGALAVFAHQLIWIAIFVLIGRWVISRGVHRLVVQGG